MAQPQLQTQHTTNHPFPWKHIIGYALSLVLTVLAFWIALELHLSLAVTVSTIIVLAIFQMMVQLFMFMHLSERIHGDTFQRLFIYVGIFFAAVVVTGSIWVMTFKSAVS